MLRARFAVRVPDHAVNVAYTEAPDLGVPVNVGMLDMSYKRAENLSAYVGGELDVHLSGTSNRIDTDEAVISSRSVFSRGLRRPIPLFYKYAIGRGNFSVVANPADPIDFDEVRELLLAQFQILDRRDNKIRGPEWDIEVTGQDANGNYLVTLYLTRRQKPTETFKIRYQAADRSSGTSYPNHIEVINATPILVEGTDYTLQSEADGYSIQGLTTYSDGIGIFYKGTNAAGRQVTLTRADGLVPFPATLLQLARDAGGTTTITLTGKSIQGVVEEINNLSAEFEAIPLSDNSVCELTQTSVLIAQEAGNAFKQYEYVRVRYNEETRVAPLMPYRDLQHLPWYPRVDKGSFNQSGTLLGASCRFVFTPQGNSVVLPPGKDGGIKYDRLDERPISIAPKILKLRRRNIDPDSLVVTYGERTMANVIADYDQLNGVLFLNREFGDISNLYVSYSYSETSIIYTGVDLNPNGRHGPALYGKFVGVYMTPAAVLGASPPLPSNPVSFDRTLYHIVGDTISEIVQRVASIKFDTGEDAKALLLGIYRVGQAASYEDVKLTDTRSRGGGLKDITEPSKAAGAEETAMFWDFAMWDGEPFPPTAVIVDYPPSIIGTGDPSVAVDPTLRAADPSGLHFPSGLLTTEQIQAKMDRYKAGGVITIINPEDSLNG